jgi:hypothetical protein
MSDASRAFDFCGLESLLELDVIIFAERIGGCSVKTFQSIREGRSYIADIVSTSPRLSGSTG